MGNAMTKSDVLTFVTKKEDGGGFDYWSVVTTGNYSTDYQLGQQLGSEFLGFVGRYPTNGNVTLLGCIVEGMIEAGAQGKGIRMGFLRAVNEYAAAAARLLADAEIAA